ncbi:MAG TPA: cytosine permease, partial [Candidatus Limnocylindrales bacterium]|nr:cytosine permease [Candidatus Limnocylindrales bacterium]
MTAETMPGEMGAPNSGAMPTREGDFTVEAHGMEPIPESARYGSVGRVFTVWFTPNLVPAAFFIGTLVTADFLKLGFVTSLLAIIVGNVVGSYVVALLSTMGPKLGLAQMPAARLPFGKSIVVPGLLNWLSTIGWDGVNSVFGAIAITILIPALPFWGALLI